MWFVKLMKLLFKALFFLLKMALKCLPIFVILWMLIEIGILNF